MADKYGVFISHRFEDQAIAESLRASLEILSKNRLEVHVCEQIKGGADWRGWIEETIKESAVLVFLFTDEDADWRWCLYELGLFRGMNPEANITWIKNQGIDEPPSPIDNLQGYAATEEDLRQFFNDMVYDDSAFVPERLNVDLHTRMVKDLDRSVHEVLRAFTPLLATKYFTARISITLSEVQGEVIQPLELDDAKVIGNALTMNLLDLPETGGTWRELCDRFENPEDGVWLEQLKESIDKIKGHRQPRDNFNSFTSNGKRYRPVLSRIETFRKEEEKDTVLPSRLFVIFVPHPELQEEDKSPIVANLGDLLKKWTTYLPSSVVRIKWRGQSDEFEYLPDDMIGEPVVFAINSAFAELYDFTYKQFPDPDGPRALTAARLLARLEPRVLPEHMAMFNKDQGKAAERILFKNQDARVTVPITFRADDDKLPNKSFLPCLVCKHQAGNPAGAHETYLLVSYVEDFVPGGQREGPADELESKSG